MSSIIEASKNLGDAVEGLWDSQIGSGGRRGGAAKEEVEPRCSGAVGDTNGTSELNAVVRIRTDVS